jgi:chromosome segregation ATPase
MRKSQQYMLFVALLSVGMFTLPLSEAVQMNEEMQVPVHKTRSYRRLDGLLTSLSRNLNGELRRVNNNIRHTHSQKTNYSKNLKNLSNHIKNVRKHLINAQRNYNHYNRLRSVKYRDLKKLYKSLRVQRNYMNMERHYLNRIQKESYKFKHYPREYGLIRKEILELRRQLNLELNDINKAYRRLLLKIRNQERHSRVRRHVAHRRLRSHRNNYNRLVGRYHSLRRNYNRRLKYLHSRLKKNHNAKNQLRQELRLLEELRSILKSYNPKDYKSLHAKYGKCRKDLHNLHRRIHRANCTV